MLAWVGKCSETWVRVAADDYSARIKRYFPFEIIEVREEKNPLSDISRERECRRIEDRLPKEPLLLLFDEKGEHLASEEFASFIEKERENGRRDIVFAIGGAYGFSDDFRKKGRLVSLSKMTFTHQMARIFALEQIYRACTILNNEKYHHR